MSDNDKLRLQEIMHNYDRMYTASIYGSVEGAEHQKECDFEELVCLVKKYKKMLLQTNYNQQHNLLTGLLKNLKVTDHEKTIQQIAHDYLKSINPEKTYYCLDENIKGSNYKCDKQCDSCSKRNA